MKFAVFIAVVLFAFGTPFDAVAKGDIRSAETKAVLAWLKQNRGTPALGGQWVGGVSVGWEDQALISGRSPMVLGIEYFDYGPVERNLKNRERGAEYLKANFMRGGIGTVVDHMPNFVTGGNAWDRSVPVLDEILPGGARHEDFVAYLDRLAAFFHSLRVEGVSVPVLFRPLHEMNGRWFWWGGAENSEALVRLWRFSHDYLVAQKAVRNVVWVWSPNIEKGATADNYRRFWPGVAYVDVVGLDGYDNSESPNFLNSSFISAFSAVSSIAEEFGLPLALTEVGFERSGMQGADFWDKRVIGLLEGAYPGISYVLLWNSGWGPQPRSSTAEGFRRAVESGGVLMRGDRSGREIYGSGYLW